MLIDGIRFESCNDLYNKMFIFIMGVLVYVDVRVSIRMSGKLVINKVGVNNAIICGQQIAVF